MSVLSRIGSLWPREARPRARPCRRRTARLEVQALEDRCLLSFGAGGLVFTDFRGGGDVPEAVALQPGVQSTDAPKIVAAGRTVNTAGFYKFALARYNLADGSLDSTFGSGGTVITAIGSSTSSFLHAVAVQGDRKIVAGGTLGQYSPTEFALERYLPDGTVDRQFGNRGTVLTAFATDSGISGLVIQPDGKIVAAGGAAGFALARYNVNVPGQADGSLDTTFGPGLNGQVTTTLPMGSASTSRISVALQADGKIVVVGSGSNGNNKSDFVLARYNPNGSLDTSFGTAGTGMVTTNLATGSDGTGSDDFTGAVAIQPADGKIVVAGRSTSSAGTTSFALVRYNPDGSLDTTFGTGAIVTTPIGTWSEAAGVAIEPDGKIVATGYADLLNGGSALAAARYNPNGSLDDGSATDSTPLDSFGTGGTAVSMNLSVGGAPASGGAGIVQPDLKIVVVGHAVNTATNTYDFALVRFTSDGHLDDKPAAALAAPLASTSQPIQTAATPAPWLTSAAPVPVADNELAAPAAAGSATLPIQPGTSASLSDATPRPLLLSAPAWAGVAGTLSQSPATVATPDHWYPSAAVVPIVDNALAAPILGPAAAPAALGPEAHPAVSDLDQLFASLAGEDQEGSESDALEAASRGELFSRTWRGDLLP